MAAKPSKSKAVAKKKSGGALVNWKNELKGLAKEESDRTPTGAGNNLSIKGSKFRHQGADLGDEIQVIIVDRSFTNRYFDKPFDEDNPSPPACVAMSATGRNMAPFDDSPAKQSEICEDCWANQWKSAERGKGKACANRQDLALLIVDNGVDEEGEFVFLGVPVTSTPNLNKYIKKLTDGQEVPPWAVVTKIEFDTDSDYEKLNFSFVDNVDEQFLGRIRDRIKEARAQLLEKPDFSGYEAPKGGKKAKGADRGGKERDRGRDSNRSRLSR